MAGAASCCDFSAGGRPTILDRGEWAARPPKKIKFLTQNQPLPYAFIHHSATPSCFSRSACTTSVQAFQYYHMSVKGWDDIGYSFVIGGDGSIFEGRGWDLEGAHTYGKNKVSLGFCLIGNFKDENPTPAQIQATQTLLEYGVFLGKLSRDYRLLGHKDVRNTACPGRNLYSLIKTWPHYGN